jgi:hypothetical protein
MARMTLQEKLIHAIGMEKRAQGRVRRAASLMYKWSAARRRVERRIGDEEVQRIINRLSRKDDK